MTTNVNNDVQKQFANYLLGGLATAGACVFSNPIDVAKTRLQLQGELEASGASVKKYRNVFQALYVTAKTEGFRGLQKGFTSAAMYQFFMNGSRLGTYSVMKVLLGSEEEGVSYRHLRNIVAGATAGIFSATVASPFYLIKTRLQAQGANVGKTTHHYKGTADALRQVWKSGFKEMYRGTQSAQLRVGVGSSIQLSTYDLAKRTVKERLGIEDGVALYLCSAAISGSFVSLGMNPLDVVATRMYNQSGNLYTGPIDCLRKTVKAEGVLALWKGLSAQYTRIIPHTLLTFLFWEQLKKTFL